MFGKDKDKKDGKKETVGEFLKVQDVNGFFKYNINPSLIESKVQAAVQRELSGQRKLPLGLMGILGMFLICAAIAYIIISGQMTETECQATLRELARTSGKVVDIKETQQNTNTGNSGGSTQIIPTLPNLPGLGG